MSLEFDGTIRVESPDGSAFTIEGLKDECRVRIPSARTATKLSRRPEAKVVLSALPDILDVFDKTGVKLTVELGEKIVLSSRVLPRLRRRLLERLRRSVS